MIYPWTHTLTKFFTWCPQCGPFNWCPQCGPLEDVDEDGCCATCGSTATGKGAEQALLCLRAIEARRAFIDCGEQPTLDLGGSGSYRKARRDMEQAMNAAEVALGRPND